MLRTQLLELRAEYEKIAEELEPGQDVIWSKPNLLCRPRFEKKGKKGTQTNRNKHIPGNQNSSSDLPLGCNFDNVGNSGADKNSEVSGSYPGPCIKCNCTTSKSLEHVIDDSDKDVCDDKETHSELPAVDTNAQKLISKQDICVQTDDFTDTREHDEHPYLQNACKSADENVPPKTTRVNGETSSQKFQKTCDAAVQSDDGGFQHDHNGTSSISNKNTNVVNKHLSKVYTKSTAHFQSPEVSGNAISTEPEEPGDLGNKDDNNIRHSTPFKETQRNAEDVVLSDGDPKLNPILVSPVAPKRPCQDSDMAADDTSVWSENPTLIATDNTSLWGSDTITNDNPGRYCLIELNMKQKVFILLWP